MSTNIYPYLIAQYYITAQFGGAKKWSTLQHNGVLFPPEYKPHKTPIIYDGTKITLNPIAEEYATLYARYLDTEYTKNNKFNKNFWTDFKQLIKDPRITDFTKIDFTPIYDYILSQKQSITQSEKEEQKEQKQQAETKYKTAIVDGNPQPVGNFRVEPPGIFIGRGCHPKLGHIKRRIHPSDIIINIGKEAKVPPGDWQGIIHDTSVEWLASWKDDITGKIKYVWLGAHSDMKGKGDQQKFDLARKLKKKLKTIRHQNEINLTSTDLTQQQIATALYFIDKFALRVGNEKTADEADTVGVTSLRIEHITLLDGNRIKLDFLSKDSVRYNRTVSVDNQIHKNITEFMKNKNKSDELFERISANDLNKYLQSFMKGLTAKVFRTYNASNLFQKELKKHKITGDNKLDLLLDEFNKANAKVALLCNHQKNINASSTKQIEALSARIKKIKSQIKKTTDATRKEALRNKLNLLKSKRDLKSETKNISLGTSKINYIDPRITVAFMKTNNIPIDKIFNKTLQDKFKWALDTPKDYTF